VLQPPKLPSVPCSQLHRRGPVQILGLLPSVAPWATLLRLGPQSWTTQTQERVKTCSWHCKNLYPALLGGCARSRKVSKASDRGVNPQPQSTLLNATKSKYLCVDFCKYICHNPSEAHFPRFQPSTPELKSTAQGTQRGRLRKPQ
jgi:hypothetical protein